MSRQFEVARTDTGWTARIRANGRVIMSSTSQVYARREDAVRAVELAAGGEVPMRDGDYLPYVWHAETGIVIAEVMFPDERTAAD